MKVEHKPEHKAMQEALLHRKQAWLIYKASIGSKFENQCLENLNAAKADVEKERLNRFNHANVEISNNEP